MSPEMAPGPAARQNVEEALQLAHRLQRLSEALAETRSPQQVLDAVLESGLEAAGASRGLIALVDASGENLEIAASRGYPSDIVEQWRSFALTADVPLSRAIVRGEPIFVTSERERDERFPALVGHSAPTYAFVCLPLAVEGRPIGGLVLSFAREEEFGEERRRFKVALAHQVAQALERTRLFEAEQTLRRRMSFLAEAGYLLSSSLDYRQTLAQLARLSVPDLADWCSVDMLSEEGDRIERLAVAHVDPAMAAWAQELGDRYPPRLDSPYGVPKVLRTGEADFVPTIDDELLVAASEGDEEFLALVRKLELRSAITVPLAARDRVLGALSLVRTRSAPAYTETELGLALELARRAGQAVDNALLLRQTQRAADAARALAHVADAVVLVDEGGFVRYWNAAAERMLGPAAVDVLGRRGADAERVREIVGAIPLAEDAPGITIPLASPDGERWLSVRVTRFDHGAVYALRDVTGEHQLERLRSEFVATASHELRTPLAAVYGAIRSLRRTDVVITDEQREAFLAMIETEAEKLRSLVDQLLVVGQLDANAVKAELRAVQLGPVVGEVVRAARVTAPPAISFEIDVDGAAPALADPELLRQLLANLVDNAVKYSPSGGVVAVAARTDGDHVTLTVADQGLGIPHHAQHRIFEKFFRVDPELRRGVGGTGLGLYIASELARRIGGQLSVASTVGEGSTFAIELHAAPSTDGATAAPSAAEAGQRLAGRG